MSDCSFSLTGGLTWNGVAAESERQTELREARHRAELAREKLRAQLYERQAATVNLRESASFLDNDWTSAIYDYLDMFRTEGIWPAVGSLTDRRYGAQWPMYRTEQELNILRTASRIVAAVNSHAGGLLGGLCAYVIQCGMKCEPIPRDGTNDVGDKRLCDMVRDVVDEFSDMNLWPELQQQAFMESQQDGDFFLRMFEDDDGHLILRRIWPELIRQPQDGDWREWSFGVKTEPGDVERPLAYWVADAETPTEGEEIEAEDIVHFPAFLPGRWTRGVKRGLPLFAFGVRDALESASKIATNTGAGVAVRQAFAYVRQWETASQTSVDDFVTTNANYSTPKAMNPDTLINTTKVFPGMVHDVPRGQTFMQPPTNPETQAAIGVVDAMLRSAVSVWNAPEWLATGNASNMGAYTSSLVAESPFVRRCKMAQQFFVTRFLRVIRRAIRAAVNVGRLPEECLTRVKLTLVPESVEVRDKNVEATLNERYVQLGVKSRQTVAQEQGLDFKSEFQKNVEFQRMTIEAQAKLPQPGQPGMGQPGQQPGGMDLGALMQGAGAGGGDEGEGESDPGANLAGPLPGAQDGEVDEPGDLDPFGDITESLIDTMASKIIDEFCVELREETSMSSLTPGGRKGKMALRDTKTHKIVYGHGQSSQPTSAQHMRPHPQAKAKSTGPTESPPPQPKKKGQPAWKKRFKKSDAEVQTANDISDEQIEPVIKKLFPKGDWGGVADVLGAPDDSIVTVKKLGDYNQLYGDDLPMDGAKGIRVTVKSNIFSQPASFFIGVDGEGKKFMRVEGIFIKDQHAGSGLGSSIFGAQVENAIDEGFDYISMHAAGEPGDNKGMNGYYTWPRLGVDESIDSIKANNPSLHARIRKKYPDATSVMDIMKSGKDGRDWWKANGGDLYGAKFDLSDDSEAVEILSEYLDERANRPATAKPAQSQKLEKPRKDEEDDPPPTEVDMRDWKAAGIWDEDAANDLAAAGFDSESAALAAERMIEDAEENGGDAREQWRDGNPLEALCHAFSETERSEIIDEMRQWR